MTTPHEAVADAIEDLPGYHNECGFTSHHHAIDADEAATAAIKALRAGAVERLHIARHEKLGNRVMVEQLTDKEIINALLALPDEVTE